MQLPKTFLSENKSFQEDPYLKIMAYEFYDNEENVQINIKGRVYITLPDPCRYSGLDLNNGQPGFEFHYKGINYFISTSDE